MQKVSEYSENGSESLPEKEKALYSMFDSTFFKSLTKGEKNRLQKIENQLRSDTRNELTETEYYYLACLKYFCEDFEEHINKGVETVDKDLLTEYRRASETIMNALSKWRDNRVTRKDSLAELKRTIKEAVKESVDGGKTPTDNGSCSEVVDSNPKGVETLDS